MSINYEDYDELDSDSSFDGAINIIEDQDGGTIVFNSSELMSANFDGGIPKAVVATSIESATDPLDMGDYIFWNFSTNQSFNPSPTDTVDGTIDESDDPADYYDTYLVTGIESDEDEVTYNISVMLEDEEYVIEGVGGTQTIYAIKEDWDEKELGTTGWLITSSGNAIFTNIAARGRIEATSGYLESLDVNGVLRIKGTTAASDPEGSEDEVIASLKIYQDDTRTAKQQGSVVVNKNGLIVRSKSPTDLSTTNAEITAKFPIDGRAPKISGYTNDDGNPDNDNNPPDANGDQIVIGGKNNNITLNGGKGNKAIYTTIQGNRTVFASPGSGETLTGFLIQLIDTDAGAGETWNTRMRLSGANGSLTFDGSDLTVTGQIRATSGFIGGESTGWQITSNIINSVGGSTNKIYLVNDTTTPKITISSNSSTRGNHGVTDTPFYADSTGKFSLSNQLIFNPASGIVENFSTIATWTSGSNTITVASATNIRAGLVITGTNIPVATTVTNVSGTTITLSKNTTGSGSNTTVTFLSDDFGELNIAGRIRGVIDSVNQIISPRLSTVTESVSIAAASGGLRTITFTVAGHAFLPNERVRIEGLPTTNNLDTVNGQHVIVTAQHSKVFTISVPSGTLQTGTVTTSAGIITLQELTMGLHPEEGQTADSWYHTQGTGIRLDKFNWWFTNNQFRVGQQDSYVKWDGNLLKVAGDLYSYTGRIASLYIEDNAVYIPKDIAESVSGIAITDGVHGDTVTVEITSNGDLTDIQLRDELVGKFIYMQLSKDSTSLSDIVLIGRVSTTPTITTVSGKRRASFVLNDTTDAPFATFPEMVADQLISFRSSRTSTIRYSGFGTVGSQSIFTGATLFDGTNSKFRVDNNGIIRQFGSGNVERITLDPTSKVSIGSTINLEYLNTSTASGTALVVTAEGIVRRSSSTQDVKDNIYNLSNNKLSSSVKIEKTISNSTFNPYSVLLLSPVSFQYIEDNTKRTHIGFIAEDIADKVPELGLYNEDKKPIYFEINGIVSSMLIVMQDQQAKIQELEERLAILEG